MDRREQVLGALEGLEYRATVGDVAARSGLDLALAQQELNAIAQDSNGHLQVAGTGEVIYAFDRNVRDRLIARDRNAQLKAFLRKVWQGLFYLVRISFGVLLILSLVIVAVGIYIALNSRDSNDRGDSRDGGGMPLFFGGDWFYIFYPTYYPDEPRARPRREMGFLESVFSFLFGDGDPNADLESERWRTVAALIQANRGVVVAEQLAPYLEEARVDNEDYVLPALVRFNGIPEVSEQGEIVYRFPELQVQAQERPTSAPKASFLQEQRWRFSRATSGQLLLAGLLGGANFLGAWYLFFLLQGRYLPPDLALLHALTPILVIYGTLFVAIPAVRAIVLTQLNSRIAERNRSRSGFAQFLRDANAELKRKLAFARTYAERKVIGKDDIIYTTEKDVVEQRDYALDDPRFQALEEPQDRP